MWAFHKIVGFRVWGVGCMMFHQFVDVSENYGFQGNLPYRVPIAILPQMSHSQGYQASGHVFGGHAFNG